MTEHKNTTDSVVAPCKPEAKLSARAWITVIVWPLVVAAAAVIWINQKTSRVFDEALRNSTSVAVVDDFALIKLAVDNGASRYSATEISEEIGRIAVASGIENTIMISRSMVLYAPKEKVLKIASSEPVKPDLRLGAER